MTVSVSTSSYSKCVVFLFSISVDSGGLFASLTISVVSSEILSG